jgi:hypothetical protein
LQIARRKTATWQSRYRKLPFQAAKGSDEVGQKNRNAGGSRAGGEHQIVQGSELCIRLCLGNCDGAGASSVSVHCETSHLFKDNNPTKQLAGKA